MVNTSYLPDKLIDDPSPFDTLETWERHLTELKSLNSRAAVSGQISHAERIIARKKGIDSGRKTGASTSAR